MRASGARRARPCPGSAARKRCSANTDLISEDEALRCHPPGRERGRARPRPRAADVRRGRRAAVGPGRSVATANCSESGPPAPLRDDGLVAAIARAAAVRADRTVSARCSTSSSTDWPATRPMNRMLQGEVGSGKTIVSVLAMLQMVDAGYQCALLAPTEVLAAQHDRSVRDDARSAGDGGAAGRRRPRDRGGAADRFDVAAAEACRCAPRSPSGEAGIVIGTHALLQDAVEFHDLGMVVVDEQHRFGVEQRDRLRAKARAGLTPAPAGDDGDADPAHRRADGLRRPGDLDAAGAAPRTSADHHQHHLRRRRTGVAGPGMGTDRRGGARRAAGVRGGVADRRVRRRSRASAEAGRRRPPWSNSSTVCGRAAVRAAARPHARQAARRREGRGDGRLPGRRDRRPGVHDRHRGRCRRARTRPSWW